MKRKRIKGTLIFFMVMTLVFSIVLSGCGGSGTTSTQANASAEKTQEIEDASVEPNTVGDPTMSDQIVVAVSAPPATFDIMTTSSGSSTSIGLHIYEMLIALNAESEITQQIATSWEANDANTEFKFKIKDGVTFHDGSKLTSEDVKASIDRYNRVGYRKDTLFSKIKSVETPDEQTLKIVFEEAVPLFLYDLALPGMGAFIVMPSEVCIPEYDYPNLTDDKVIGTGLYKLEKYVPDDYIMMQRFGEYVSDVGVKPSGFTGEKHAWFEHIKFAIVPEKSSRLNGLMAGEYQYVEELDITTYDKLTSSSGIRPEIISPAWIPITMLNTMSGPLANPDVRQAMLIALDDETTLIAATGRNSEFYEVDPSPFYSYQYWHSDIGADKYNQKKIDEAKALVKKSGYNGETIIWATTKDYEWMYQIAVVVQQQMKAIGLNIELQINDWPTQVELLVNGSREKEWDMFSTGMSLFDVIDPTGLNGLLMQDTVVLPYDSAEMDKYMQDGMSSDDPAIRKKAYDKMTELLYTDVPFLIYGKTNTLYGASDKLMGEKPWFVTRMWNIWLEK